MESRACFNESKVRRSTHEADPDRRTGISSVTPHLLVKYFSGERAFAILGQLTLMTSCRHRRAALSRQTWIGSDGHVESSRPAPSAGGRHPHVLVLLAQDVSGLESGPWALDPDGAALHPIDHDGDILERALLAVSDALRLSAPPAVIFTVARPDATLDRYPAGISLLWRDAGVLLAVLHLIATDLGLGSCIAGTSGVLFPSDGATSTLVDTGAIAIGSMP